MSHERSATIIALASDQAAAEALASQYPGGAGSFGPGARRLSTVQGATTANATHLAVSGTMDGDMVEAFEVSVVPIFMVMSLEGTTFDEQIASREPPLYKCVEDEAA